MSALLETPTRLICEGVGIEVWVTVDGNKVPHYATEHNKTKKEVSCWIESETGKSFSIVYKKTTDEYAMGLRLFLDGSHSGNHIILPMYPMNEYEIQCVQVSPTEGRRFVFGPLELTDDDAYLNQPSRSENFGEIRVVIDKKASVQKRDYTTVNTTFKLPQAEKVHERSKKGLTHQIIPGTAQPMGRTEFYDSVSSGVLTTFVFRYRTRAMLQAHGIIMQDSVPSASTREFFPRSSPLVKRKISEEQSDKDEDGIEAREKALIAELEKIRKKKLSKEPNISSRKKIKRETEPPKFYFKPGEVIDLTDDDPTTNAQPPRQQSAEGNS